MAPFLETLPDIRPLVDQLLGRPYAEVNCFALLRHLFAAGWGLDLEADPVQAAQSVLEYWHADDPRDLCTLVQPWDILVLRDLHPWGTHVGVVVDTVSYVHTRPRTGVVLEPIQRWRRWVVQVARLQRLL